MKRILLVLLALCLAFPLSSCSIFGPDNPFDIFESKEDPLTVPEVHTHTFGEWKQLTAPTCANDGVRRHTCECGTNEVRMIPATGLHDYNSANTCTKCGVTRLAEGIGEIVTLGEYPQTIKADDVSITSTVDSRGYYLGSDGEYYAKVKAYIWHRAEYSSNKNNYGFIDGSIYCFSDGTELVHNTEYYFKVEPIKWRVIRAIDGTATLLCESVLVNHAYDDDLNNYKDSTIRTWLNEEFLQTAFGEDDAAKIIGAMIDNSAASNSPDSTFSCENTTDKVFLPCYRDMVDATAGFSADPAVCDEARMREVTDYARACGAYFSNSEGNYGYGCWWLRSPATKEANVWCVNSGGNVNVAFDVTHTSGSTNGAFIGVVPVIRLAMD